MIRWLLLGSLVLACSSSTSNQLREPEPDGTAGQPGEFEPSQAGSRNRPVNEPEPSTGGAESEHAAGAAGSPVDEPEAAAGGQSMTEPTNDAGAGGEPVVSVGGAGGEPAVEPEPVTAGAGGNPSDPDPEPTAGAGGAPEVDPSIPAWRYCDGVTCGPDELCVRHYLDVRHCKKIGEYGQCDPTVPLDAAVIHCCDDEAIACSQPYYACTRMINPETGRNCPTCRIGGREWDCGPPL